MRWLILAALVAPHVASAGPLRHEDAELIRPELVSMTGLKYEPRGAKLVEVSREVRAYDANGRITRHEHATTDGKSIVTYTYVWDPQNRLQSRTYRDQTGRVEARTFTYKLDANGRIDERIMRDPSKGPKEYYRYEYTWEPDGSHVEREYVHDSNGQVSGTNSVDVFDNTGRLSRQCADHYCSMFGYDSHGNLDRVREQNREQHHYRDYENTYDSKGRLVRRIVYGTDSSFAYNAKGDVKEVVEKAIASQGGQVRGKTVYTYRYR